MAGTNLKRATMAAAAGLALMLCAGLASAQTMSSNSASFNAG